MISRVFTCKFMQIYITSVSGCLCFTFKICQIIAGTSMIRQFHEFFEFLFGGFFQFGPIVAAKVQRKQILQKVVTLMTWMTKRVLFVRPIVYTTLRLMKTRPEGLCFIAPKVRCARVVQRPRLSLEKCLENVKSFLYRQNTNCSSRRSAIRRFRPLFTRLLM